MTQNIGEDTEKASFLENLRLDSLMKEWMKLYMNRVHTCFLYVFSK